MTSGSMQDLLQGKVPLLSGKVAVVTGASDGIGLGIARFLGAMGASVVLTGTRPDKVRDAAEILSKEGLVALGVAQEVTDTDSCRRLADRAIEAFGAVDLLVNNAGISDRTPLGEMEDDVWDRMIAVNLTGVERTTRAFLKHMKDRRQGSIVNISSVAGRGGKAAMTHYCATKFGVIGFSQALALELAPYGIRVNTVCPGIVRTRLWEIELAEISAARGITIEDAWELTMTSIPLGRPQTPEDIGAAVSFLASPLAANITGQALNVDGGHTMS